MASRSRNTPHKIEIKYEVCRLSTQYLKQSYEILLPSKIIIKEKRKSNEDLQEVIYEKESAS